MLIWLVWYGMVRNGSVGCLKRCVERWDTVPPAERCRTVLPYFGSIWLFVWNGAERFRGLCFPTYVQIRNLIDLRYVFDVKWKNRHVYDYIICLYVMWHCGELQPWPSPKSQKMLLKDLPQKQTSNAIAQLHTLENLKWGRGKVNDNERDKGAPKGCFLHV